MNKFKLLPASILILLNFGCKDDDDFKPHQAEVMVKTFVSKKHIVNLDNF